MGMTRPTDASKTTNSPVDYETVNNLIAEGKETFDAVTYKHTTSGVHDDPLLPKGRGRVTFSGGTPTLAQSWGIVASLTDTATGVTKITIGTASSNTTGIHVSITLETSSANEDYVPTFVVNDTTNFTIYTRDPADSGSLQDVNFTFAVWID